MSTPLTFSETLRWRRLQLGLTQADVAAAIGVESPDFISLVEKGERRLDLDRVPSLAEILRIDPIRLSRLAVKEKHPQLAECIFNDTEEGREQAASRDRSLLVKLQSLNSEARSTILNWIDHCYQQTRTVPRARRVAA